MIARIGLALTCGAIAGCVAGTSLPREQDTMTIVRLDPTEREVLFRQDAGTAQDGGFQSLLVGLQSRMDAASGEIALTPSDLERIPRYAFDYKNGGWEDRLIAIFSRHLGPGLGR